MLSAQRIAAALLCSTLLLATGCVAPLACGPQGACGPIALGGSCGSCDDCNGCGELYLDPWINHPPQYGPCDLCGNHNGQSCGRCRSIFDGFATFWGYRCEPACDQCNAAGCDGGCGAEVLACDGCDGCDSCGYGGMPIMDGQVIEGPVIDRSQIDRREQGREPIEAVPTPTPAKEPQQARPSESTFLPGGTRKIFRPKNALAEKQRPSRNY